MSKRSTLIGMLLALVFLVIALWKVDLGKLFEFLATANYWYILVAAASTLCGYVFRTLRWGRILRPTRHIPLPQLFPILMIGFMANNVLPARAGEFVRVYALQRRTGVGKSVGLSTLILERIFDGLTLVLFVGLLSLRFPLPQWGTGLAEFAGVVFLGLAAIVALLLLYSDIATRVAATLSELLPDRIARRSLSVFDAAMLGLHAMRGRQALASVGLLSLLVWLAEALSYFLVIQAFSLGLEPDVLPLASVFLLVVVNLAIMLPSAPGYVGTFQAFAVLALAAFGVSRESALGIAIVAHAMQYLLVTGLGVLFVWRLGLHFPRSVPKEVAP